MVVDLRVPLLASSLPVVGGQTTDSGRAHLPLLAGAITPQVMMYVLCRRTCSCRSGMQSGSGGAWGKARRSTR